MGRVPHRILQAVNDVSAILDPLCSRFCRIFLAIAPRQSNCLAVSVASPHAALAIEFIVARPSGAGGRHTEHLGPHKLYGTNGSRRLQERVDQDTPHF